MFLWNIWLKDFSSFVQHDQFFHSKIFCQTYSSQNLLFKLNKPQLLIMHHVSKV